MRADNSLDVGSGARPTKVAVDKICPLPLKKWARVWQRMVRTVRSPHSSMNGAAAARRGRNQPHISGQLGGDDGSVAGTAVVGWSSGTE